MFHTCLANLILTFFRLETVMVTLKLFIIKLRNMKRIQICLSSFTCKTLYKYGIQYVCSGSVYFQQPTLLNPPRYLRAIPFATAYISITSNIIRQILTIWVQLRLPASIRFLLMSFSFSPCICGQTLMFTNYLLFSLKVVP